MRHHTAATALLCFFTNHQPDSFHKAIGRLGNGIGRTDER